MRKKYRILVLFLAIAVAAILISNRNMSRFGISEGTYTMVTEDDEQRPRIHFYDEGEKMRFVLASDIHVSAAYTGRVEQNGKKLHCINKDKTWVFEIQDEGTIRYCRSESSEYPLPDGAIFQYEK